MGNKNNIITHPLPTWLPPPHRKMFLPLDRRGGRYGVGAPNNWSIYLPILEIWRRQPCHSPHDNLLLPTSLPLKTRHKERLEISSIIVWYGPEREVEKKREKETERDRVRRREWKNKKKRENLLNLQPTFLIMGNQTWWHKILAF